jgi:predicted  nucleic acid-binding Zn-ribbon protein
MEVSQALEFLRVHWGLIGTTFAGVGYLFWLVMDKKYAHKETVAKVREDLRDHAEKIAHIETKIENLPTVQDFSKLQVLMTEIKGETKAANTKMQSIDHQVGLLLEAKVLKKE